MAKLDFPSSDQSPWTNPDNGITYVWKGGTQGAWHIASAGDTDIFVVKAGDKMTGDLTLGPEGDTNITLDATEGSATFAGITTSGDLNAGQYALLNSDGYVQVARQSGTDAPSFLSYLGADVTAQIKANGSASFAETIYSLNIQTFTGTNQQFQYRALYNNKSNFTVTNQGVYIGTDLTFSGAGYNTFLKSDGSASFGGVVNVGLATITPQGYFNLLNAGGDNKVFTISKGNNSSNAVTSWIDTNGNASFNGNLNASGRCVFGIAKNDVSMVIEQSSPAHIAINGINTGTSAFAFYVNRWDSAASNSPVPVYSIKYNGTASFSNAVLNLEPDNDANYTTTTEEYTETESYTGPLGNTLQREVTKTRDIRTYSGPTLDVKERLQNLIARLDSLEAEELADDATSTLLLTTVNNLNADMTKTKAALTAIRTAANAAGTLEQLKADIATATADI